MKKYIFPIIAFVFFSCSGGEQTSSAEEGTTETSSATVVQFTKEQIKTAGVETSQAEKRTLNAMVKVNGVVDVPPQNLVTVSFPMGGFLQSTELLPGSHVKKGQIIAVMTDQSYVDLQQEYLVSRSQEEVLRKEFDRQKQLNATKATSDKQFEQAEAAWNQEKVKMHALAEKLMLINIRPEKLTGENISRSTNIYSPIDGYVSEVKANVGKYVNPEDVLFELVNPADLHLALTVFERDLLQIKPGQKVKAYAAQDPSKTFEAEVILVSKKLDENRTAIVHCHFESPEVELIPGMFITAEIAVSRSSEITLPDEGIVRFGENQFVFVQESDGVFRRVKVQTGISEGGWTEIVAAEESLQGKTLITKNAWSALMKMENKSE